MKLENSMLSKISQLQKDKQSTVPLVSGIPKVVKITETESRVLLLVTGVEGK